MNFRSLIVLEPEVKKRRPFAIGNCRFSKSYLPCQGREAPEGFSLYSADNSCYLVGGDFWTGLLDWLKARLLTAGNIDKDDFLIVNQMDEPDEIVNYIRKTVVL